MLVIRRAGPGDIDAILELQRVCYPVLAQYASWRREHFEHHQARFPEGQFVAAEQGRVLGFSAGFITRSDVAFRPHTYSEITQRGTFAGHDPSGDTLYGAEIMVHPDARRKGVGRRLYEARHRLASDLGLRFFAIGGRIPGYGAVESRMSAQQYVDEVVAGRRHDRVLSTQLNNGFEFRCMLPNYMNDPSSGGYAVLLVQEVAAERGPRPRGRSAKGTTSLGNKVR